jgi:CRP/FNR family transcriptional regulator, cyclic AMP receptor protein
VLGPGEVFGEMSVADSLGRSASVESSAILARNLAEVLSGRVRLANSRLISLASLDMSGRVASELLSLASEYGQATPEGVRIPMRLTQSDLAALVGASRVSVNQDLGQFRKRNLITIGKDGRVSIRDEEALDRRAR